MKNLIFIAIAILLFSCQVKKDSCENKICTAMFASVTIKYVDVQGNPLVVKNFEALNLRTNKPLTVMPVDTINFRGYYTVASDADLIDLSEEGDQIRVTATHPQTGNTKQIEMIIAGGKCACHVSKISGVGEVVL